MATHDHTPQGRGYDTGLSYFHHSNDYYTEAGDGSMCHGAIDIWGTDAPASDFNTSWGRPDNQRNGTLEDYEEFKFMNAVLGIIQQHPKEQPLFLTYVREFTSPRSLYRPPLLRCCANPPHCTALHCTALRCGGGLYVCDGLYDMRRYGSHLVHEPLQVPTVYLERMEEHITDNDNRLMYHAMVSMLDDVVGNVTTEMMTEGLWNNTLFLLTSDNGGPSYNAAHTANNFPLRGSKLSDWEGGVRVTAFVAGGWVPANQRGTERLGLIAIADWHKTFCELRGPTSSSSGAASSQCGVDAAAAAAGLPPLDSISMVDYLRGDEPNSPRLELQVDSNVLLKGACE